VLLSVIFKAFVKIDRRIASKFGVLATLIHKLKTATWHQNDVIIDPQDSLDTIYIVYNGCIQQSSVTNPEAKVLMAEDILGMWSIKERTFPRRAGITAKVISEEAKCLILPLAAVDEVLELREHNALGTFVNIVYNFM